MSLNRAKEQELADRFDADLHRLICRADRLAEQFPSRLKHWEDVAIKLSGARITVRMRMSERDRSYTR